MADTYGAITLPAAAAPPGGSVTDPLLDYSLAYFQAVINAKLAAAWVTVAPGTLPVKTIKPADPEEVDFLDNDLPALYMWRTGGNPPERLAEDIWQTHDKIHVLWILPPARQAFQRIRTQFVNGLNKDLHEAIELGRDPCWIVPNDEDVSAQTFGSVFARFAGWSSMYMGPWSAKALIIDMEGAPKRSYYAYQTELDVTELFDQDITRFAPNSGVQTTVTNSGGVTIAERTLITP